LRAAEKEGADMPEDQRKGIASLLFTLGIALFLVVTATAPSHPKTAAPAILMLVAGSICLVAGRIWPSRGDRSFLESEDPGLSYPWIQQRTFMIFAGILFLLGFGLWGMFTGSL
jgi:hypothetical protein